MKPLINLKSFLAVLLILIVPAALLVAYFRNYSTESAGHEHSEKGNGNGAVMGKSDSQAAMGHDTTTQPPAPQSQKEDGHAAMDHGNMAESSARQSQPSPKQGQQQPDAASAREQPSMAMLGTPPGIPGASHLYHLGATGFFLDHPQHLTLNIEQKKKLNQIKEQAQLNKASADRKAQEVEQQLWKLTALAQPDTAQIETKVREIEKLHTDQRLAFIRSVGEAAKVLTEEQTKILLGNAAPVMPDAKPAHQHKP